MVSSSSRVLLFARRIPSISFPVRMVDGVRVTGVQQHSQSSSSSSPIPSTESSKSSKVGEAVKVVVFEEECEIVNVRLLLVFVFIRALLFVFFRTTN